MHTFVKSGFAAAAIGLGILATGGSAYAAPGCLTPEQSSQSLVEHSSAIQDAVTAANAKGFRCDVVASEVSVRQPGAKAVKVAPKTPVETPKYDMPLSIMGD
ncbi:MAG: hypothetical protein JWR51_902 [Devosia sp.]|uniref:hypothetical protein n=1 Tax=Devosia sp. TaxID=1871048 RepID=UPI00260406BB|nr:hypothetical protein [Devosia sp.]MDB5527799.1 hypothetical protein [Devosia sp.]